VLHGVGAIRAPALRQLVGCDRIVALAELLQGVTYSKIGRRERVRVPERPHGNVLGGPGADSGKFEQSTARLDAVRSGVDHEIALGQRRHQSSECALTRGGHRCLAKVRRRESRRGRKAMGHPAARLLELLAAERDQATGQSRGGT